MTVPCPPAIAREDRNRRFNEKIFWKVFILANYISSDFRKQAT